MYKEIVPMIAEAVRAKVMRDLLTRPSRETILKLAQADMPYDSFIAGLMQEVCSYHDSLDEKNKQIAYLETELAKKLNKNKKPCAGCCACPHTT